MRYTLGETTNSIQTVEAAIAAGMIPLQVSGDTFYFELEMLYDFDQMSLIE